MKVETLILGAGAAGMMCAAHAGPDTLVIDHARAPGEKIRISGGGRCNFTNLHTGPGNFLSQNLHFCKSALARYTQWDFIDLVERHGIAWHEKTLGQLFCDGKSGQIIAMLRHEMDAAGGVLWLSATLAELTHDGQQFSAVIDHAGKRRQVTARHLVLATGGKSIPKMGASGLSYDIATRFGLNVTDTRPALVPFTFPDKRFSALAGLSVAVRAAAGHGQFDEALLFTHRGLSGPAMLQISSFWREGDTITVNLDPDGTLYDRLRTRRTRAGGRRITTELSHHFPNRLADSLAEFSGVALSGNLADQSDATLQRLCAGLSNWQLLPSGTEGYRTAEVTLGGVDTNGLSSRTLEARHIPGLFVIGEAVDVTGWLGGYNFQWAWSSGVAAGQAIAARRQQ